MKLISDIWEIIAMGLLLFAVWLLSGCTAQERTDTIKRFHPIIWNI